MTLYDDVQVALGKTVKGVEVGTHPFFKVQSVKFVFTDDTSLTLYIK